MEDLPSACSTAPHQQTTCQQLPHRCSDGPNAWKTRTAEPLVQPMGTLNQEQSHSCCRDLHVQRIMMLCKLYMAVICAKRRCNAENAWLESRASLLPRLVVQACVVSQRSALRGRTCWLKWLRQTKVQQTKLVPVTGRLREQHDVGGGDVQVSQLGFMMKLIQSLHENHRIGPCSPKVGSSDFGLSR